MFNVRKSYLSGGFIVCPLLVTAPGLLRFCVSFPAISFESSGFEAWWLNHLLLEGASLTCLWLRRKFLSCWCGYCIRTWNFIWLFFYHGRFPSGRYWILNSDRLTWGYVWKWLTSSIMIMTLSLLPIFKPFGDIIIVGACLDSPREIILYWSSEKQFSWWR